MELRSQIEINATPERVWEVLTDFDAFAQWNPYIPHASGNPRAGERLEVHLDPPGGKSMTFRPEVVKVEPGREFRWLGHLFVPGLFDGEHIFEIEPLEEGRARLVQREDFRGILVPLARRSLETSTQRGFEEMNEALKERAEAA